MKRTCSHCRRTFEDDDDRFFCPYCGEILDSELKLAAQFHKIHQEYQESQKKGAAALRREAKAKTAQASQPVKITTSSNHYKTRHKKKRKTQQKTNIKNKQSSAVVSSSALLPVVVLLIAAALFYLFFVVFK